MAMLLAEVMDKVVEGFTPALAMAMVTAPVGFVVGRWTPRPLAALALALVIGHAGLLLVADLRDPFSIEVRQHAWREAGPFGVALDLAAIHLGWLSGLAGLLAGLALRRWRSRRARS